MKFCFIVILIEIADKEKATVTADFNYRGSLPYAYFGTWKKTPLTLIPPLTRTYTANDYRQTTDELMFKSVVLTQRYQ